MTNKMKILGIIAITSLISFTSCDVDDLNKSDLMGEEIASELANIQLSNSGYETEITNDLVTNNGEGFFTSGTIQYKYNNEILATVDFGAAENEKAFLSKDGFESEFYLKKKKEGSKYKKVIIHPLVKTDDCNYIVEGTIKYYEIATGELAATVYYGNGTCDKWATKTWPAGSSGDKTWPAGSKTFSLDEAK
jgi:hypothetical protein